MANWKSIFVEGHAHRRFEDSALARAAHAEFSSIGWGSGDVSTFPGRLDFLAALGTGSLDGVQSLKAFLQRNTTEATLMWTMDGCVNAEECWFWRWDGEMEEIEEAHCREISRNDTVSLGVLPNA